MGSVVNGTGVFLCCQLGALVLQSDNVNENRFFQTLKVGKYTVGQNMILIFDLPYNI